ncbi:hypothetical protein HU200_040650 [Digitaria exilis]|uniref:F-box domain-containing protein n=1 Tax=Digitaria exilis TaxID=1010633 RepID=A0A835EER0_9POAL|nr:hypothetical protein HU200_040650 [Digitaria exilis]
MAGLSSDPSWSDLPVDVLLCILDRLELPPALAFASVCTTWRSTALAAGVPCCSGPWLMTWADLLEEREKQGRSSSAVTCNFYHLLDVDKAYGVTFPQGCFVACCGASHGWLVLVNELSNLVLYNPFTTAIIHLPPITDFACVNAVYGNEGNLEHYLETGKLHEITSLGTWFYQKAVLSCSPSKGGDYVVMIIHRDNDWLSFVKSGQSKWQVASIIVGRDRYADCAYHYGRFYAVTFHGMVEQWDIDDLNGATRKVVVTAEIHMGPILSRHLLSTSWGDLLQVHAHLEVGYPDRIRFQIHKVSQDGCKKLPRKDFVDHALFLGLNHSACLPTKKFPKLRAQCIYYSAPWMVITFEFIRRLHHGWGGVRT